ncbi:MAG: 2-oxoacid:ferredoxin oxidoreductase subunit beta [bacterium]
MFDYEQYLRKDKFPHIWCAGCGDGILLKSMLRAIHGLGWEKEEIVMVSGIGCSARMTGYVDFQTVHTLHGRALAYATGIKMARPDQHVIVVTGDGDGLAIGGNHFIHAARRNIDISVILMNNSIYGMTGGQVSPATPTGARATTAPHGAIDPNFDISRLAIAAGASYVARNTVFNSRQLENMISEALSTRGFTLVETVLQCPTIFGRLNKKGSPSDMLADQKERSVSLRKAEKMSEEELEGKIVTGVLHNRPRPEYSERYQDLTERVGGTVRYPAVGSPRDPRSASETGEADEQEEAVTT